MTRPERLRRVVILCTQFMRNLAYHRVAFEQPVGWKEPPLRPLADFLRSANSNFLDIAVLDWCKLFGDAPGSTNGGTHCWWNVLSNPDRFGATIDEHFQHWPTGFDDYRQTMRSYRDRFLAHLDTDKIMRIPRLEPAELTVTLYHGVVVSVEASTFDLSGLPDSSVKLRRGYEECERKARQAYKALLRQE